MVNISSSSSNHQLTHIHHLIHFINNTTKPKLSKKNQTNSTQPHKFINTAMAGLLETIAVPRAAAGAALPSLSPVAGRRSFVKFSVFNGLKIQSTRSSVSFSSFSKSVTRRGGRIVCEAQDTAVLVPGVNDQSWETLVIGSELPVLVEFWAPWCGPCRMIHPVIDELSQEFADKFKFFKVNTDESPGIATRYGIRSIPTVMIFKDGEKKDTVIGAVPKTTLTACIEKFL